MSVEKSSSGRRSQGKSRHGASAASGRKRLCNRCSLKRWNDATLMAAGEFTLLANPRP